MLSHSVDGLWAGLVSQVTLLDNCVYRGAGGEYASGLTVIWIENALNDELEELLAEASLVDSLVTVEFDVELLLQVTEGLLPGELLLMINGETVKGDYVTILHGTAREGLLGTETGEYPY